MKMRSGWWKIDKTVLGSTSPKVDIWLVYVVWGEANVKSTKMNAEGSFI